MDAIKQVVSLLDDAAAHKRIAAAIVLGHLKPDSGAAVEALARMAADPLDALAVPAIEALAAIGSPKALPALFDALGRSKEVQAAAKKAISAIGPAGLEAIQEHMKVATPAVRSALAEALAGVGGKKSFDTLLKGLYEADHEAVHRAALAVRHEIKTAGPRDRQSMLTSVEHFLEARKTQESEQATRAALKILGYLELADAIPTLLAFTKESHPPMVRIEAVTALRYPMAHAEATGKALGRIVDLLEDRDALVRRTARETLAILPMPKTAVPELLRLARGRDAEVARFAINRLADIGTDAALEALGEVVLSKERDRVQEASRALMKLKGGPDAIALALSKAADENLARLLAESVAPRAAELDKKLLKSLLSAAVGHVDEAPMLARYLLEPVGIADPKSWGKTVREQAARLAKKQPDKALPLFATLCRSQQATAEDRYGYAKMLLDRSARDAHPSARQKDPALDELVRLAEDGFPLGKTLAKDKALDDEARFYVGFDFVERQSTEARSAGALLLEAVAAKGPRTKLGKAAKNKLSLSGLA